MRIWSRLALMAGVRDNPAAAGPPGAVFSSQYSGSPFILYPHTLLVTKRIALAAHSSSLPTVA